jgi:4-(2-carboxyphenyl)-2-oxobut-3-enoate aldolase
MASNSRCRLTVDDIRGVWAIIPTCSTPDAGNPRYGGIAVDVDESKRAVSVLIDDGADGILSNGTFGEEATLTPEEWKTFVTAILEEARGRVPMCPGTTMLSTRETIERMKFVRDRGAHGTMLGRPMWCQLSPEAIVKYYRDAAEAVPELGIVIYDNPEAFKGRITPDTWAQLAEIPQVVAAKTIGIDKQYEENLKAVKGRIRLMPLERDWTKAVRIDPAVSLAAWAGSANCGMDPCAKLRDLIRSGHMQQADALTERITWSYETFFPNGDFHEFSKYNIPLEKERFNAAGYIKAGPTRPPYDLMPKSYLEGSGEAARRWRVICAEVKSGKFDA